jgi:RND superfamily putative drug exporter
MTIAEPTIDHSPPPAPPAVVPTGLERWAGRCYDHRRAVLLVWILLLIGVTAAAQLVGTHFQNNFTAGNTPSQQAANILDSRFPTRSGDTADVVFETSAPITSAANRAAIAGVVRQLRPLAHVVTVTGPFSPGGTHQVSADGHIAYAVVQFNAPSDLLPAPSVKAVITTAEAADHHGFSVALGGNPISAVITAAPGSSEGIGVTAAILIMLLAFGSVVAMGLPIVTALFGLGIGIALLELVTHLLVVPTFAPEMAAMIGIGVGIDYALFIATRYRQGIFEGRGPRDAVIVSIMTAGRAVLFAGGTVVISLFGLFLIGQAYMIGLAVACIAAVLLVLLAALSLLPALLGFAGEAIDRIRLPGLLQSGGPPSVGGFWYRWSRFIARRAWVTGTVAALALIALAVPLFSLRLTFTDAGNDPPSLTTRQAYDLLAQGFGPGFNGPLVVAVAMPGPSASSIVEHLRTAIAGTPGVAYVVPPQYNAAETGAVLVAYPTTSPQAAATETLVRTLRNDVIPSVVRRTGVDAQVGGETAGSIDAASFLGGRLPVVIAAVLALAFLFLMAVFRSVVLPLKAVVMNLLSVGAA